MRTRLQFCTPKTENRFCAGAINLLAKPFTEMPDPEPGIHFPQTKDEPRRIHPFSRLGVPVLIEADHVDRLHRIGLENGQALLAILVHLQRKVSAIRRNLDIIIQITSAVETHIQC